MSSLLVLAAALGSSYATYGTLIRSHSDAVAEWSASAASLTTFLVVAFLWRVL